MNHIDEALASIKTAQESLRALAKESIGGADEFARWAMSRVHELDQHVEALTQKKKQLENAAKVAAQ